MFTWLGPDIWVKEQYESLRLHLIFLVPCFLGPLSGGIPSPESQDFLLMSDFSKSFKVLFMARLWNFLPATVGMYFGRTRPGS